MMNKCRTLNFIKISTSRYYALCHGWRTTREDTNLLDNPVKTLYFCKKLCKFWPTKMSDSTKTSKQTSIAYTLKVTFTDVLSKKTGHRHSTMQSTQVIFHCIKYTVQLNLINIFHAWSVYMLTPYIYA